MKITLIQILTLISILFSLNIIGQSTFNIDANYWEACETGEGPCDTLIIERNSLIDSIQLVMPCGGTFTTVKLFENNKEAPLRSLSIGYEDCPPTFDLTELKDGNYLIYMTACNLGGPVYITLTSKK